MHKGLKRTLDGALPPLAKSPVVQQRSAMGVDPALQHFSDAHGLTVLSRAAIVI